MTGLSLPRAPSPPAPPGARAEPLAFAEIPGWSEDDHGAAFSALLASCRAGAGGGKTLRQGAVAPETLRAVCAAALSAGPLDNMAARRFFEARYRAHRIVPDGGGEGFFTGYYEPEVPGSLEPSEAFSVPVLARPADLVTLPQGQAPPPGLEGLAAARRLPDGRLAPYPDRTAIEEGALGELARPLLYLVDPVDRFVLQVQGSGRVRLPDGNVVRLAYDGRNGQPYTAIGRVMADRLGVPRATMTMPVLREALRRDASVAQVVMRENRSFVFFRIADELDPSLGPIGGEGVPLTPGRSLAIDRSVWAYGLPVFVDAELPAEAGAGRWRRLMIAQDTGSAIVGPARADIFFGSGPEAGAVAGVMRHGGAFIVLWPVEAPEEVP